MTDADGKVQVMFKAGNLKGTAILRAYFLYELPTGCDAVAGSTAFIQMEDVPAKVELATDFVSTGGSWNAVVKHDGYTYGSSIGKTGEAREFLQNTDVGIAIPEGSGLVFHHNPADPGSNSFELTGSVFNRQHSSSRYSSTEKGSGSSNTDLTETRYGPERNHRPGLSQDPLSG